MKIFWDPRLPLDFTPGRDTRKVEKGFEAHLREALEGAGKSPEPLSRALDLVEEVLPLIEKFAEDPVSRTRAETLADLLEERARELESLLREIPQGPLHRTISEAALFFGVEAEKLRRGFYT
ncbi:hypothetical protein [Thermosulfurimonas sp. F29]|uniref:hypothetical protein n=1 Tax=Thermosulfurimonas sp. F29 TaxID=2867247 RepID=UPI001C83D697|nr:hypothetical protein [Thermosulfurimonas sp. F29]MBX6422100.1 hypothetical protein [Thermosulfurimonas sp. F29]